MTLVRQWRPLRGVGNALEVYLFHHHLRALRSRKGKGHDSWPFRSFLRARESNDSGFHISIWLYAVVVHHYDLHPLVIYGFSHDKERFQTTTSSNVITLLWCQKFSFPKKVQIGQFLSLPNYFASCCLLTRSSADFIFLSPHHSFNKCYLIQCWSNPYYTSN